MKQRKKQVLALFAALALILTLLSACGGNQQPNAPEPAGEPTAAQPEDVPAAVQSEPAPEPADQPEAQVPTDDQPEDPAPADEQPEESAPLEEQPAEPASAPVEPEEQKPEPTPEPELEPEPTPEPAETVPEDGAYTASVTLSGGTGRATVESPAVLRCENGSFYATIVWSSSNYDYMKVGGERYDPINTEGNSTFEIPVSAFDQELDVIGDTIAMSEPHEVEYTLYFDSTTLQKQ